MDDFTCAETVTHEQVIQDVDRRMSDDAVLCELSEFFRVFGDSTRIRILYALSRSEMCVCDLANLLGMTQSAISHQLALLKRAKLIRPRREVRAVFYSLADGHVRTMLDQGMEHVNE